MNRQRIVTGLLAAACVIMTGITLHQYSVPLVPSAEAQVGSLPTDSPPFIMGGPNSSSMKPAPVALRKAATTAILAQLRAFAKDDYQTAVQYQSHNLRHNFQSVSRFRQMITVGYPEFAHYRSVRFEAVRASPNGQRAIVPVTLVGEDGVTIKAVYLMVREHGSYKIDGVGGAGRPPRLVAPGAPVDA